MLDRAVVAQIYLLNRHYCEQFGALLSRNVGFEAVLEIAVLLGRCLLLSRRFMIDVHLRWLLVGSSLLVALYLLKDVLRKVVER